MGKNSSAPVWQFSCGRYSATLSILDVVCTLLCADDDDDDVDGDGADDCCCGGEDGGVGAGCEMELASSSNWFCARSMKVREGMVGNGLELAVLELLLLLLLLELLLFPDGSPPADDAAAAAAYRTDDDTSSCKY